MKQLDPQCKASPSSSDALEGTAGPALRHHVARGGHASRDAQASVAAPACSCSPYRIKYDERRAHTAASRPDWTDGHSHNDALRVASKEILKDLWRASREWHLSVVLPQPESAVEHTPVSHFPG